MSTFVRVKRHRSEISSDALVLRLKKQRLNEENDNESELKEVLTYAGTLDAKHAESQEEIIKLARTFPHTDKQHNLFNIREKARANQIQNRKERVLRIINSFRQDNNEQPCHIIHAEILPENETQCQDIDSEYVFDVFSTRSNCVSLDDFDDSDVVISEVIEELAYCNPSDNISESDSEDSNAENYYTNDYPDTETDDSEEDILNRMKQMNLENDFYDIDDSDNYSISDYSDTESDDLEQDIANH